MMQKQTDDILLLDIEMGEMDGVTMAKKLRKENDTVQIIFITGYSDYILENIMNCGTHRHSIIQNKKYSRNILDIFIENIQNDRGEKMKL